MTRPGPECGPGVVAAVDIGTNTVRCLLARPEPGGCLVRIAVLREITRLGEGLRANGRLSPAAERRTLAALGRFGEAISAAGAAKRRAVATSASRDAGTPGFLAAMGGALGFPVEVIAGGEEAALTALGMRGGVGEVDGIALDIGGGSTELVRVCGGRVLWWRSLQEGVVHLTEAFLRHDPPQAGERAALAAHLASLLAPLPVDGGRELVATAGTPTTLAALDLGLDEYDPALVNGHRLAAARVGDLADSLFALPAAGRLALPGMEPGREDLLPAGALFLLAVMGRWGFPRVTACDWGLLEGIALELLSHERSGWTGTQPK